MYVERSFTCVYISDEVMNKAFCTEILWTSYVAYSEGMISLESVEINITTHAVQLSTKLECGREECWSRISEKR